MTLVIIAGGIDLSIGSIIALDGRRRGLGAQLAYGCNSTADGTTQAGNLIDQWPILLPIWRSYAGVLAATIAGFVNGA